MTRRDYVLISTALREARSYAADGLRQSQHARDCRALGDAFEQVNKAFDRTRFLLDCGLQARDII